MNEVVPSAEIDAIKRDIAISAKTERAFKDYCRLFGYTHRNIRNKTILDVGAGYSSFTEAANGMGANVVKLDGIFMKEYGFLNKKNENA